MMEYLQNVIDKDTGKARLQQIEVKKERARQLYDTFQTFITIGAEYMRRISDLVADVTNKNTSAEIEEILKSFLDLIEYINGISNDIAATHNIRTTRIIINTMQKMDWNIRSMGATAAATAAAATA